MECTDHSAEQVRNEESVRKHNVVEVSKHNALEERTAEDDSYAAEKAPQVEFHDF